MLGGTSEEMYKATQEAQDSEGPSEVNAESGDDVTDVEFEEVKEEK